MYRLLIGLLVLGFAFLTSVWERPVAANHSVYPVTAYLYHPTGDGGANNAMLTCGWHDICDGYFSDAEKKGLDWIHQGNVSYYVWFRLRIYGGQAADWAGRAQTTNAPTGCKRLLSDVYRVNWSHLGTVTNQHSSTGGSNYFNLYVSAAGYQNAAAVGAMIQSGDNCQTSGPHAMQWYSNDSASNTSKNTTTLPYESGCYGCGWLYNSWSTYEWLFSFWTAP